MRGLTVLLTVAAVVLAVWVVSVGVPRARENGGRQPLNPLRNLAQALSAESLDHGWPELPGSEFALAAVARGIVDVRNPDNLEIFWPEGMPDDVDMARYREITWETLGQGTYGDLTSIAGRRTNDPRYRIETESKEIVPILGHIRDGHLTLAYSNGTAKGVSREELGLPPGEALVFGDASSSPLLRALADRDEQPRGPGLGSPEDALRTLTMVLSARSLTKAWPELPGSEFALAVVADGMLDVRDPENLTIFWPDGMPADVDIARYRDITWDTLGTGAYGNLTEIAGRRTNDPRFRMPDGGGDAVPILGFVRGDVAILAFSDGSTRALDREALGLEAGEPIVFGERSPSELLQALADR